MARDMGRPIDTPTPLKKQDPSVSLYKQGGDMTPDAALSRDKSDTRKPVGPGDTTAPGK
jgi:hypothetical protein